MYCLFIGFYWSVVEAIFPFLDICYFEEISNRYYFSSMFSVFTLTTGKMAKAAAHQKLILKLQKPVEVII